MSSTDELRQMLDERGVEWYEACGVTFYGTSAYGTRYAAREPECGIALDPLTPEQAIAATLPHAASAHAALLQESKARMALQRDYNNQVTRIQNQRKQLREMQAALERGRCHLVTESTDARDWPNNERCDRCGEYVAVVSPEVVRYCPSCGRRIVE